MASLSHSFLKIEPFCLMKRSSKFIIDEAVLILIWHLHHHIFLKFLFKFIFFDLFLNLLIINWCIVSFFIFVIVFHLFDLLLDLLLNLLFHGFLLLNLFVDLDFILLTTSSDNFHLIFCFLSLVSLRKDFQLIIRVNHDMKGVLRHIIEIYHTILWRAFRLFLILCFWLLFG